jgi:hypothetical protein
MKPWPTGLGEVSEGLCAIKRAEPLTQLCPTSKRVRLRNPFGFCGSNKPPAYSLECWDHSKPEKSNAQWEREVHSIRRLIEPLRARGKYLAAVFGNADAMLELSA